MAPAGPPDPGDLDLVLRFVNTKVLDMATDDLASVDGLTHWLHSTGLLADEERATPADVPRTQAVREALREAMAANHDTGRVPDSSLQVLNAAARDAMLTTSMTAQARPQLRPEADGVPGALGAVLALVLGAMNDGTWTRLKVCADETCRGAFYDRSRSRSARWDSMDVCGNRAKQRAWRERRP